MINVIRVSASVVVRSGGTSSEFEGREEQSRHPSYITEAQRLEMNKRCDEWLKEHGCSTGQRFQFSNQVL